VALTARMPLALTLAALAAGCGTQYSDPIRLGTDGGADACAAWTTEVDCRNDTAHGCTFQPNDPGCHPSDPDCPLGTCRSGDPFVRRSGQSLSLRGAPYGFVGTVSWGIAWGSRCTVDSMPDHEAALLRTFDDLVDMRVAVLKIWGFQSYAGAGGVDYANFERVIAAARQAGVRLIFVLENHYADCSEGPTRDDAWYAGGHRSPYGSYALSFPDYARRVVARFRDEPTILAWEIMHEARGEDFDSMSVLATDLTDAIDETDPNHLIVLGTDNGDSPATSRTSDPPNFTILHGHPAIDLIDSHDFYDDTPLTDAQREVSELAVALDKPVFAGATAVSTADESPEALVTRAEIVEAKLEAALDSGFAGFLVYDYFPDWTTPGSRFDARPDDPLGGPNGVLARHAGAAP